jgi:glycosyltransferase involved in cell wall biosynthesis
MLTSDFELHLVTTSAEDLFSETRTMFDLYGTEHPDTTAGEVKSLYNYLKNNSPDVVSQITRPPKHGTIVSTLGKKFSVPTVYRLSGDRFGAYSVRTGWEKVTHYGYNNIFGRIPVELSNRYITLGQNGKHSLINKGVSQNRITILPPAVDGAKFRSDVSPVNMPSVPSDRHVVLFVGRLIRLKGIRTLESVIPSVVDRQPDLHFVLVGEPTENLYVPEEYRDHVTVIGAVPPDEMPRYYALADILLHPSLTEGLPLVLIESLLSEVPIIAREVGDISDITDNTFTNDEEAKRLLCNFKKIPLDSGAKFDVNNLATDYKRFYALFE